MANQYQGEIDAVNKIRSNNPDVGQRTLARKIKLRAFPFSNDPDSDFRLSQDTSHSPEATIYGRIRRFDKANRNLASSAA